jgi:peptide/nickel transport system ATP-binding protein/oligopeptide transport system ATP-binding protein
VLSDVSFELAAGETLGIVGESGSGKTATALALIGLLPPPLRVTGGRVLFEGRNLLRLAGEELRSVRGGGIGFVFQEPMSALSPVFTVGDQVAEALVVHGRARWTEARRRAVSLLEAVRIPDAAARARDYPHQLSGGLRQRAMIAIALACDPALLVADEPTTALDATVQAEVLDLLDELRARRGLGLLLVTHDLGVVASRAHGVAVMYAGRIVEQAPVAELFAAPRHPYTQALLATAPGRERGQTPPGGQTPREGQTPPGGQTPPRGQTPPPGRRLTVIEGAVPSPAAMPPGCAFEPRCPARMAACRTAVPATFVVGPAHEVACLLHAPTTAGGPRGAR